MAELAGRVGDGINVPGGPGMARLVDIALEACRRAGRDPAGFLVTASGEPKRLEDAGVHRQERTYSSGRRLMARGSRPACPTCEHRW